MLSGLIFGLQPTSFDLFDYLLKVLACLDVRRVPEGQREVIFRCSQVKFIGGEQLIDEFRFAEKVEVFHNEQAMNEQLTCL